MEQAKYDRLRAAGIGVDEALRRFMNNEALLTRFLGKFADDGNYKGLKEALERGDEKAAFEAAHTLKGVAGNLSLERLYKAASAQTELLREGRLEEARDMMLETDEAYRLVIEALAARE